MFGLSKLYGYAAAALGVVLLVGAYTWFIYSKGAGANQVKNDEARAREQQVFLTKYQERVSENAKLVADKTKLAEQVGKSHERTNQAVAEQRRLNAKLGRLRDHYATPGSGGPTLPGGGAAPGVAAGGAPGADLSAEASSFLLDFAEDADRAAAYGEACHAWITQGQPQ